MKKQRNKGQSLLSGAFVLLVSTIVVHIIGILFKIPLTAIVGTVGRGYFSAAYTIYTPIYAISMAGLPIAVSTMVSERMATGRYREVRVIYKIVKRLFLLTGFIGTAVLLLLAYPYTHLKIFINTPRALPCIIAIAPSVFFCCLMSAYRGYYEGMRNMKITAYSQIIEAVSKLIFGIVFAKLVMSYGYKQFTSGLPVFGEVCKTEAEVYSAMSPYTAAAAVCGVTVGSFLGLVYVFLRHKILGDGITKENLYNSPRPKPVKDIRKHLISIAIPIVTSTLILNITNLIDSWTILNRLSYVVDNNFDYIKNLYSGELLASHTLDKDVGNYLYGAYGTALDFKILIPTITMSLGVSAIPVLSAAWAVKDRRKIHNTVEQVLRASMLFAIPSGLCMAILARPLLTFMYIGSRAQSSILITSRIVVVFGLLAGLMSLSSPIINMLQAIGRSDIPVKSLIIGSLAKIISNFIFVGIKEFNIYGALIGTFLFYLIIVNNNMYHLLKETKVKINVVSVFIKPLFCSILAGLTAWSSYGLLDMSIRFGNYNTRFNGSLLALIISSILAIAVYFICLFLINAISKSDILMLPKGEKVAKVLEKYGLIG